MTDDYPDSWKTPAQRQADAENRTAHWLKGLRTGTGLPTEPREDQDAYPKEWR